MKCAYCDNKAVRWRQIHKPLSDVILVCNNDFCMWGNLNEIEVIE